jgi:hypothetical protein
MKKLYVPFVLLLIFAGIIYLSFPAPSLKGSSDDGTWKVVYKKMKEIEAGGAWVVSVTQTDDEEVNVEKLEFLENDKVISDRDEFYEGKDIDDTVYTLHPFSFPDLYYGEPPNEDSTYFVVIRWKDAHGKTHEDKIELK